MVCVELQTYDRQTARVVGKCTHQEHNAPVPVDVDDWLFELRSDRYPLIGQSSYGPELS